MGQMVKRFLVLCLSLATLVGCGTATEVASFPREPNGNELPAELAQVNVGQLEDVISNLEGTVVVNVWATWCPPCRAEAALLADLDADYPNSEVSFLGVSSDRNADAALEFLKEADIMFPNVRAGDGVAERLGATSLPTTLVIDEAGKVVMAHQGQVTKAQINSAVDLATK